MNNLSSIIEPNTYFQAPDAKNTIADLTLLCDFAERKKIGKQKYIDATTNIRCLIQDGYQYNQSLIPTEPMEE